METTKKNTRKKTISYSRSFNKLNSIFHLYKIYTSGNRKLEKRLDLVAHQPLAYEIVFLFIKNIKENSVNTGFTKKGYNSNNKKITPYLTTNVKSLMNFSGKKDKKTIQRKLKHLEYLNIVKYNSFESEFIKDGMIIFINPKIILKDIYKTTQYYNFNKSESYKKLNKILVKINENKNKFQISKYRHTAFVLLTLFFREKQKKNDNLFFFNEIETNNKNCFTVSLNALLRQINRTKRTVLRHLKILSYYKIIQFNVNNETEKVTICFTNEILKTNREACDLI